MDFKEKFKEILEDLDGRFKNPLILSFILVWSCQHWELIFMFFNFDSGLILNDKTDLIKYYLKSQGFKKMVLIPLWYSFLSLMAFYIIGVIAQAIKVWLGKRFSAAMLALSDNGNYELKSVSEQYKKRSRKFRNESKAFEEQIVSMKVIASEDEEKIMKFSKKITELEDGIRSISNIVDKEKGEVLKLSNDIISYKKDIASRDSQIESYITKLKDAEIHKVDYPKPNTNPLDIFGTDVWNVYNYNDNGEMELTDKVMFDGKSLVNNSNEKQLIKNFEFYSRIGTIIFKKGEVINKLFISNNGEFLKGMEDGELIAYQKLPSDT